MIEKYQYQDPSPKCLNVGSVLLISASASFGYHEDFVSGHGKLNMLGASDQKSEGQGGRTAKDAPHLHNGEDLSMAKWRT